MTKGGFPMRSLIAFSFCAALACSSDFRRDLADLAIEQQEVCFERLKFVREYNRATVFERCIATAKHRNEVMR
jgi:hypothetical protein